MRGGKQLANAKECEEASKVNALSAFTLVCGSWAKETGEEGMSSQCLSSLSTFSCRCDRTYFKSLWPRFRIQAS